MGKDIKIDIEVPEIQETGYFVEQLKRTNKQIKNDRAKTIAEDAFLQYKRVIEDLEMGIRQLKRERENMLDLSPTDATSLVLAKNFNSVEFVKKDIEIGVLLRNEMIKYTIAKERYNELFEGV